MPVPLRTDFDAAALRAIARTTKDGPQARRLLALAAIYDGATRTEAARIGGVTVQIVRDWVVKFNAHGPDGLIGRKPSGRPSRLTDAHRAALVARVDAGPIPAVHGVVRWRLIDLIQWLWEEFRITIAKQTLSRELRAMNYTPWKTSGSSCGRTGSRTGSSRPTATSSITAAKRGTSSPISPGSSCPSDGVTGFTGSDQRDLVSGCR